VSSCCFIGGLSLTAMNSINVDLYQANGADCLSSGSRCPSGRPFRAALVTETFPPEVNGVAMTWGKLTQHLLGQGHMLQVVRPRQLMEASDVHAPESDLFLTMGLPIPAYPELRFGLASATCLARLWRRHRPGIVHVATEGPLGWSAVSAAQRLGIPVSSSFHTNFEQYSSYYGAGLIKPAVEAYLRMFHNRTLATLAPTRTMARSLADRGFRHTGVLSRGVDTVQFSPRARSRELRASWGVDDNGLAVLYVGRLAKEKSVGTVLTAFAAIQNALPAAKLVIVGDGPMRETLRDLCPQAIFCGVKKGTELATHYASGDVFLFPSLTETFGNVVPEALASGLAVVSYDRAAAAELIVHGENGLLAEPGDEALFVREAVRVAVEPRMRDVLRRRAAPSIAHMSWDAVARGLASTMTELIEQHSLSCAAQPPLARDVPGLKQRSA